MADSRFSLTEERQKGNHARYARTGFEATIQATRKVASSRKIWWWFSYQAHDSYAIVDGDSLKKHCHFPQQYEHRTPTLLSSICLSKNRKHNRKGGWNNYSIGLIENSCSYKFNAIRDPLLNNLSILWPLDTISTRNHDPPLA